MFARQRLSRCFSAYFPSFVQLVVDPRMVGPWTAWSIRRYAIFISHALLHFSLAGGFVIPKITKVLNSTGYLSGTRTKRRVFETQQFVLDVAHSLEYLKPGTGTAWESTVQVRFLHAGVRARLSKISRAHSKYYSIEEHGVPINQEDLLATLFGFSNVMWRVMETRMDVSMTTQEREDYLHLWRYIGYIMGVDDILGAVKTPDRADACIESITLHLSDPDTESGKMCATLLKHMTPSPIIPAKILTAIGLPDPFKLNMAMAESLLGPALWRMNGLPTMTRRYRFLRSIFMYLMYFDLWLTTKAPWWYRVRRPLLREGQYLLISRELGRKRTQFELKELPKLGNTGFEGQPDGWVLESYSQRIWPKMLTAASVAVGMALLIAPRV